MKSKIFLSYLMMLFSSIPSFGTVRPDKEFKIFQFPIDQIPRIDGEFSDWEMVTDSYSIGLDELSDTKFGHRTDLDPKDYNVEVKVGWVKDLNRLYFYVEAEDDYWDFDQPDLGQDIFEVVVDADLSGGPLISSRGGNKDLLPKTDLHFKGHGSHAQNYHIFTPAQNKDWAMIWGNAPWLKDFPYFNAAYDYNFKHGDSGKLTMEFWITPFDYAHMNGFSKSTFSELNENELIGLGWCILDYDGKGKYEAFMNLAHDSQMVYDASFLCAFRLMPLEEHLRKLIQSNWSFVEMDRDSRWMQFKDESYGKIEKWHWDFGDETSSNEQHPKHQYDKGGTWTVILTVVGPDGKSIRSKVWDVVTR